MTRYLSDDDLSALDSAETREPATPIPTRTV